MNYLEATLYGVIQGLTEFLPISSSGHLALLPQVFHFPDPGVSFDFAMHLGTSLAVMTYFFKDVSKLTQEFISSCAYLARGKSPGTFYALNLFISVIFTAIGAYLLKNFALSMGRQPHLIGLNLIVFGIFLFLFDWFDSRNEKMFFLPLRFFSSALIGLFQAVALFPGVSRSGATISTARALGIERSEATRFSFLLSAPVILGGFFSHLSEFRSHLHGIDYGVMGYGVFISFLVGVVTIHFFIRFTQNFGMWIFALYRIIVGTWAVVSFWPR